MKRRPFLKLTSSAIAAGTFGFKPALAVEEEWSKSIVDTVNGIPYRMLGKTGEKVSIVGFPGLALVHDEQEVCNKAVKKSIDAGINYLDVAPAYGNGSCEIKLGEALKGIDRSSYLLACKTKMRDKKGAREELERSLKRLNTDHFDVYQMHHLRTTDEVKQAFGPDGCMETFFEAQKEGKVRFFGFSAHTTKSALLAMKNHKFDTVMFPINFIEYYTFGFGDEIIDMANQQGAAVLAIKPMCGGYWPEGVEKTRNWWYRPLEDNEMINIALSYSLSKKGVTVGIPPGFLDLNDKAISAIKSYHAPSTSEIAKLETMAKESLSVFEERQKQYSYVIPHPEYHDLCPYATA